MKGGDHMDYSPFPVDLSVNLKELQADVLKLQAQLKAIEDKEMRIRKSIESRP